jgi:hypothetical protein
LATASQVDSALDAIALSLTTQREAMVKVKAQAASTSGILDALPTAYSDAIATINGYGVDPVNPHESLAVARLAKYTAEFVALKAVADAVAAANLG